MRIRPIEEKSLAELLGIQDVTAPDSPVGARVHAARQVPLKDMSDWDLALLLRQRQGPAYLAPLALERLESDIWLDAGLYKGDLLLALLMNRGTFGHRRDLEEQVEKLIERARENLDALNEIDRQTVNRAFTEEGLPLE